MKKIIRVLVYSFVLNLVWENLHSFLYSNYKGGEISQYILVRSALIDALFITAVAPLFIYIPYFRNRKWYALIFGVIAAVALERFALGTGRWAYNEWMPIVPLLNTGLTPTIQLGVISYVVYEWCIIERDSW